MAHPTNEQIIQHSKPWITTDDVAAVGAAMKDGMIARGARVRAFEEAVTRYHGTAGSVAVGSATAAIELALKALGIGDGDEVILPTYVCISVANAVKALGAVPVLCDVGNGWNMTPKEVEVRISKKTKVIIVVHIFGIAADTKAFLRFGIPVIEDCCQAFGAVSTGRMVGTIGSVGIFSFHAIKCLTTGEGGMATAMDPAILERMRALRERNAIASPMSDMQAVLGLSQLGRYDVMLARRRDIAKEYFDRLPERLTSRLAAVKSDSIFFRFPLIIDGSFEAMRGECEARGFAVRKGVDELIHREYGLDDRSFPGACRLFETTLSLPVYPALRDDELERVLEGAGQVWPR